ncbi:dna damage response protein [Diaporthe amygdali]|uniref:dna damage response protein n=1 Tax=Phomopsis amygdali TaxID=1214568 RepID=UPI0022FF058C|nr:dna damage response protein [Diaporthe amygdali]KAJ0107998.1 dna damage response protein [Diaporthe amygdali]
MWLLESDGDIFGAGCFVIQEKTISRKHLTIEVGPVTEGDGTNLQSRSTVTIEDLKTKIGTLVNGKQIKGERFDLIKDANEIKLGHYRETFRIKWQPVVLSFSFSKRELETDPWTIIRQKLEPVDVKYIAEYDHLNTTHVVSKRRNTAKVLQALINGKHIVVEGFMEAIIDATTPAAGDADGAQLSALEKDFDANWPEAMQYIPPKADAPGADRPDELFAPDERRRDIFEGYTFIFYEKTRFEELHPVITSGKGKALLSEVAPGQTTTDDFIRYVKGIAGEKGLGEFEDGSEGKGVVVVRYAPPPNHEQEEWYLNFYNQVALRLDHRPVEPRDFLPAILDVEPGQLRRPLEFDSTQPGPVVQISNQDVSSDSNGLSVDINVAQERELNEESPPRAPKTRRRERRAPKSRFKGFDTGIDEDEEEPAPVSRVGAAAEASQGMFMTQPEEASAVAPPSQHKRPFPEPDRDIMEDVAPTAAAIKRRRLENGEVHTPPRDQTPPPAQGKIPELQTLQQRGSGQGGGKATAGSKRGKKAAAQDEDILDLAIQFREEEEATAQAERERLARELRDGDIDYEAIRRLTLVEPMNIRRPQDQRTRDQDIQEGRWDPRWNGRKNFKKFRKQGEPAGRPQQRVIMSLEPVRMKEHGIGNKYWLEDGGMQSRRGKGTSQPTNDQGEAAPTQTLGRSQPKATRAKERDSYAIGSDDSENNDVDAGNDNSSLPDVMDIEVSRELARSRKGKAATRQSQAAARNTLNQTQALPSRSEKRSAVEAPAVEKPAKRRAVRSSRAMAEESDGEDDDESDDGLNFRFGRRK